MKRFHEKIVVITGAAQGIGFAIAERFAAEGAFLFLVDNHGKKLAEAVHSLSEKGAKVEPYFFDISEKGAALKIIAAVKGHYGHLDILVNNAGIVIADDFFEMSEEAFEKTMQINLMAPFYLTQAAAKLMVEKDIKGSIINLSSVNAVVAIPTIVPYVTSKGGIQQLTRSTALALADKGIRVNAVGPGSIETEMLKTAMGDPKARDKILSRTPMGRAGQPSEIAGVVAFLASDDAGYITGETIYVDGGRLSLNYTVPLDQQD